MFVDLGDGVKAGFVGRQSKFQRLDVAMLAAPPYR